VSGIGVKGELWYTTDDGMAWSGFDVDFRPDDPAIPGTTCDMIGT
jgi:hypothetical protein